MLHSLFAVLVLAYSVFSQPFFVEDCREIDIQCGATTGLQVYHFAGTSDPVSFTSFKPLLLIVRSGFNSFWLSSTGTHRCTFGTNLVNCTNKVIEQCHNRLITTGSNYIFIEPTSESSFQIALYAIIFGPENPDNHHCNISDTCPTLPSEIIDSTATCSTYAEFSTKSPTTADDVTLVVQTSTTDDTSQPLTTVISQPTTNEAVQAGGDSNASSVLTIVFSLFGSLAGLILAYAAYKKSRDKSKKWKREAEIKSQEVRLRELELMIKLNPAMAANVAPDMPANTDPWEYLSKKHGVSYKEMTKQEAYRILRMKQDEVDDESEASSVMEDQIEFAVNRPEMLAMKEDVKERLAQWESKAGYKRVLGEGSFGTVYKVKIKNMELAVKQATQDELCDKVFNAFYMSARMPVDSRFVMPFVIDWTRGLYIMNYVDRNFQPLKSLHFTTEEYVTLCYELRSLCDILNKNNICHTDMHLNNILYDKERSLIRLIDFDNCVNLKAFKTLGLGGMPIHVRFHAFDYNKNSLKFFDTYCCVMTILELMFTKRLEPKVSLDYIMNNMDGKNLEFWNKIDKTWSFKSLVDLADKIEIYSLKN